MNSEMLLRHRLLNSWPLFWVIFVIISVAMLYAIAKSDLRHPEQVSGMVALSVRWSVPWLYLAFAASALQKLAGSDLTRWLLRNRKIMGLCFAAGMAWQLLFILWLTLVHREYYVQEVYVLRDAIEGVVGYLFLIAMTVTSFKRPRAMLKPKHWKLLHTVGIYWLWAYAFSVYWHELFYYTGPTWNLQPDALDYLYYAAGLAAILLRIAGWSVRKTKQGGSVDRFNLRLWLAWAVIFFGLAGSLFANLWGLVAYEQFWDTLTFAVLEELMPFWPFIPFLPLFLVFLGTAIRARLLPASSTF